MRPRLQTTLSLGVWNWLSLQSQRGGGVTERELERKEAHLDTFTFNHIAK